MQDVDCCEGGSFQAYNTYNLYGRSLNLTYYRNTFSKGFGICFIIRFFFILLSNLYKYIGKAKNADEKRQKFFGTLNMINGLSSLSKRHVYKNTREPIANYLKDLLKQSL